MTASTQALTQQQLTETKQQFVQQPQQLLDALLPQRGNNTQIESDRLLALTHAQIKLGQQQHAEQLLTQLSQRELTPVQLGHFGLLDGILTGSMHSQFERALEIFQQASMQLAPLSSPNAVRLHIDVLLKRGSLQRYLQRYEDAEQTLKNGRKRALAIADNARIALLNEQLGRLNRSMGNFQLAVEYFQSALSLAPQVDDDSLATRLQLYIGQVFRDNGDYNSALHYAHSAAEMSQQMQLQHLHANALSELGYIHEAKADFNQAIYYHLLTIDALKPVQSTLATASAQLDLGRSYNQQGNFTKALGYLELAQAVFEQRQHKRYLFENGMQIAQAYLRLSTPERALQVLAPLQQQLDSYRSKQRKALLLLLSKANLANGDSELAWQQLKQHADIQLQPLAKNDQVAIRVLAEQQLRQQLQQEERAKEQLQTQVGILTDQRYVALPLFLLLTLALLWNMRQRGKSERHGRLLRHQAYHHSDSSLPNRSALMEAIPEHNGMMLLLQLGQLPNWELQIGSKEFNRLRQQIAIRLGHQEGLVRLYEVSPGLFAMTVTNKQDLDWIESLQKRIGSWPLLQQCGGAHVAIGAIELPFQPGSMLHLPAECSLQLAQLALAGAIEQQHKYQDHCYVLLQPVALNAPLLKPDAIYQSANKCINNGVIRCCSNHNSDDILWPQSSTPENETRITPIATESNQADIGQ
ncbi:tetratricopeptide repeat protein [uncultured Ferrimonas sp.]|uniref:tetratricopeptide repeat protein n=1 Tax=uncultured Ferrimonas sp. TaxID=432640 RepID=UPI002608BA7D|nr:tetratricopeptide repeat protein [uncultured Ferrimonas sp.]